MNIQRRESPTSIARSDAHVALLVDQSGSMHQARASAVAMIREFVFRQRMSRNAISIWTFNHRTSLVYSGPAIQAPLGIGFEPHGGTALRDAIGGAIHQAPAASRQIVAVVTDGMENSSTEWPETRLKGDIALCLEKDWKFLFLCVHQRAKDVAVSWGIPQECCTMYEEASPLAFMEIAKVVDEVVQKDLPGFSESQRRRLLPP